MVFEFRQDGNPRWYEFQFCDDWDGQSAVEIKTYWKDGTTVGWVRTGRNIEGDKVLWHDNDQSESMLCYTPELKQYIERFVKMKAFW